MTGIDEVATAPSVLERAWYSAPLEVFCSEDPDRLLGQLARRNAFALTESQRDAWIEQTRLLQSALTGRTGKIYLEFAIPRMGSRIDAVVVTGPLVLIVEFKVGERRDAPPEFVGNPRLHGALSPLGATSLHNRRLDPLTPYISSALKTVRRGRNCG